MACSLQGVWRHHHTSVVLHTINAIGANPDELMAILQALDQAGAIEGELQVM